MADINNEDLIWLKDNNNNEIIETPPDSLRQGKVQRLTKLYESNTQQSAGRPPFDPGYVSVRPMIAPPSVRGSKIGPRQSGSSLSRRRSSDSRVVMSVPSIFSAAVGCRDISMHRNGQLTNTQREISSADFRRLMERERNEQMGIQDLTFSFSPTAKSRVEGELILENVQNRSPSKYFGGDSLLSHNDNNIDLYNRKRLKPSAISSGCILDEMKLEPPTSAVSYIHEGYRVKDKDKDKVQDKDKDKVQDKDKDGLSQRNIQSGRIKLASESFRPNGHSGSKQPEVIVSTPGTISPKLHKSESSKERKMNREREREKGCFTATLDGRGASKKQSKILLGDCKKDDINDNINENQINNSENNNFELPVVPIKHMRSKTVTPSLTSSRPIDNEKQTLDSYRVESLDSKKSTRQKLPCESSDWRCIMNLEDQKLERMKSKYIKKFRGRHRKLVGLVNFGNTCYCNSVLQALLSCSDFCRYLLAKFERNKIDIWPKSIYKGKLLEAWMQLVLAVYPNSERKNELDPRRPVGDNQSLSSRQSPKREDDLIIPCLEKHKLLLDLILKKNDGLLAADEQNDAHEFFEVFLRALSTETHDPLMYKNVAEQRGGSIDGQVDSLGHSADGDLLEEWKELFSEVDSFWKWQFVSIVQCRGCYNKRFQFQCEYDWSLEIPQKFVDRGYAELDDLLKASVKETIVEDVVCTFCRKKETSVMRRQPYRHPKNFVCLQIKRFAFDRRSGHSFKLTTKIKFPKDYRIDINKYLYEENNTAPQSRETNFRIIGITLQHGTLDAGHYSSIMNVMSDSSTNWTSFSDCSVHSMSAVSESIFGSQTDRSHTSSPLDSRELSNNKRADLSISDFEKPRSRTEDISTSTSSSSSSNDVLDNCADETYLIWMEAIRPGREDVAT